THAGIADHIWMRITLTESPLPALYGDGSGPAAGHPYGETEDYALHIPPPRAGLLPAATDGETYEPNVAYYDGY
ncbi:MAG TPA: hypothetical protein VGE07_25230, partial [Herpetosiphonaceae bacterium]